MCSRAQIATGGTQKEVNDDERDDFRRELERLSAGLSERYPYAF